jgi:hypothetical protein
MDHISTTTSPGNGHIADNLHAPMPVETSPTANVTEANTPIAATPLPAPFDLASLRLDQDFTVAVGVRKAITTVPCRKPNRQEFIRVRGGKEFRLETTFFEDKINQEIYIVNPKLRSELADEIFLACLFLAISRQGNLFVWPCKLPSPDGRSNSWNSSALAAAKLAEKQWIRMCANMSAGSYDTLAATGSLPDPEWPEMELLEIIQIAFRGRFIDGPDHPVWRALRGE